MKGVQWVYIEGKWRPVMSCREIRRGRNKGRLEVQVKKITVTRDKGWRWIMRRFVVNRSAVRQPIGQTG